MLAFLRMFVRSFGLSDGWLAPTEFAPSKHITPREEGNNRSHNATRAFQGPSRVSASGRMILGWAACCNERRVYLPPVGAGGRKRGSSSTNGPHRNRTAFSYELVCARTDARATAAFLRAVTSTGQSQSELRSHSSRFPNA